MKLKSLKPSMREKKRYILVKGADKKQIEEAILQGIGAIGYSETGLNFIEQKESYIIMAVNHASVDKIRACFALFPNKIAVEGVSGTLRGLRAK